MLWKISERYYYLLFQRDFTAGGYLKIRLVCVHHQLRGGIGYDWESFLIFLLILLDLGRVLSSHHHPEPLIGWFVAVAAVAVVVDRRHDATKIPLPPPFLHSSLISNRIRWGEKKTIFYLSIHQTWSSPFSICITFKSWQTHICISSCLYILDGYNKTKPARLLRLNILSLVFASVLAWWWRRRTKIEISHTLL